MLKDKNMPKSFWAEAVLYVVLEARRTKLKDKGEKCILVGYGDRTMGYWLYNPVTKKMNFSRDVIFEENESWNWDQTKASRSNNPAMSEDFKMRVVKEFEMIDIGLMAHFLGIEVVQSKKGDVDPTYFKSLVGSLRYLACTRPDILYGVGLVNRYMETPDQSHLNATKRILCYIKGTINDDILYTKCEDCRLIGYSDSDWGIDLDERKSTTSFTFFMRDTAFTWLSKKQAIVTLLSCEAEYIVACSGVCHGIWIRNVLQYLGFPQVNPTKVYIDNRSAITLAKNLVFHERSKHIDMWYHFIREHVKKKEVELVSCRTYDQAVDIFTKPLKHDVFLRLKTMLIKQMERSETVKFQAKFIPREGYSWGKQ
ncbi:hypothetical protein EZV62_018718 [Acer yangbiense]|uniref:Retroviral polymerase SH3-like domain-containing protein n=1 Tax=Acer yangbiense TaxID=1000413 RepID=A0A5C7HKW8_9ROSI|nr:hypothetical protein EZV62_018718 [Acer yangbiense]